MNYELYSYFNIKLFTAVWERHSEIFVGTVQMLIEKYLCLSYVALKMYVSIKMETGEKGIGLRNV